MSIRPSHEKIENKSQPSSGHQEDVRYVRNRNINTASMYATRKAPLKDPLQRSEQSLHSKPPTASILTRKQTKSVLRTNAFPSKRYRASEVSGIKNISQIPQAIHAYTEEEPVASEEGLQVSALPKEPKSGGKVGNKFNNFNHLKELKRSNRRSSLLLNLKDHQVGSFFGEVEARESLYLDKCINEDYDTAAEVLVTLMNFTIDYNITYLFTKSLRVIADFYILVDKPQHALFFYNEARDSAILLNQPVLIIESLMGMANCCSKERLEKEAIIFLKKAVEYAWMHDLRQLELRLYDDIGRQFYHLGQIQKAKKFHQRYINSLYEPNSSAIKMLSRQRLKKMQQVNIETRYTDLNLLFLVHLKVPICSVEQIPLPAQIPTGQTLVRNSIKVNRKYFGHHQELHLEVGKIIKTWLFREQIDEFTLPEGDWTAPMKAKKFGYIDFKLNQHLAKLSGASIPRKNARPVVTWRGKESLEEQVARKLKEPPLRPDWYEIIIDQISRDHKNKLLNVRHAVRMRGHNKKSKPSMQVAKDLYYALYEGASEGVMAVLQRTNA